MTEKMFNNLNEGKKKGKITWRQRIKLAEMTKILLLSLQAYN